MSLDTGLPGGLLDVVDRHSRVWDGVRFAHHVLRDKDTLVSVGSGVMAGPVVRALAGA